MTKLPTAKEVARELQAIHQGLEFWCDIRLQVREDGQWEVHVGDPCFDADHHGYWGASFVPASCVKFEAYGTARDLLEQVEGQLADLDAAS